MPLNPHLFNEEGQGETVEVVESANDSAQVEVNPEHEYTTFKEKYKEMYDKDVQGIIKKRLGDTKRLESEYNEFKAKFEPKSKVLEMLSERFGTDDVSVIERELEAQIIEKMAFDKDADPDTLRQIRQKDNELKQAKMEADSYRRQNEDYLRHQEAVKKATEWQQEAEKVVEDYPDFKLQDWATNDLFMTMLKNGFGVKQAYEAADLENVKKMVSQQTEKQTANNIRAGKRVKENATGSTTTGTVKKSISEMTSSEIREMERRALSGETVSF